MLLLLNGVFFYALGGLFVNGMLLKHLSFEELKDLEPTMLLMAEGRLWTLLDRRVEINHSMGKDGLYHIYRKSKN